MDTQSNHTTIVNTAPVGAFATTGGTAIYTIQQHYTGFAPEMLHKPIETLLEQFRQGNKEVAKGQLKILRDIGGQDPRIQPALDVVSIYLNLLDVEETVKAKEHLKTFLAQSTDDPPLKLLADLCVSALLRLEIQDEKTEGARLLWKAIKFPGLHSKETFYSLVATADELENVIDGTGSLLTVTELRGVVEGTIRVAAYQLANAAVKFLIAVDEGPSTRFLELCVNAGLIEPRLLGRHFWSITASLYDELMQLANGVAELLLLEPLPDTRLPLMAARLFLYLRGGCQQLTESCWNKVNIIEKVHPECAALIRYQKADDSSGLNDVAQKIFMAEKDESFRKKCSEELLSQASVNLEGALFLSSQGSTESIKKWLENGGVCDETEVITRDLITLRLHIRSIDSIRDRDAIRELKRRCEVFLKNHRDSLPTLNPDPIIDIAGLLDALNLPFEACSFLEPLLPNNDYWPSPLLRCYIDTLICADRRATLAAVLDNIPIRFWSRWIWQVKASQEFALGNFSEAKTALEKAADFGYTARLAVGLIDVMKETGDEGKVPQILSEIPDSALPIGDRYSQRVIVEMFKRGLLERAEQLLINHFIAAPEKNAVAVTDIINSLICGDNTPVLGINSDSSFKGVKYFDGKTLLTKLIVPPELAHGQYLLSSSTPLGERLLMADAGESFKEGLVTYRLEEKMPASVAAYQISLHIRDIMNAGNDCFHMFQVPEDPVEIINHLQEIMSSGSDGRREILEHESLPLMVKGHMLRRTDPVAAALSILTDSAVKKPPLLDFDSEESAEAVILDIYSVCYLAITGLIPGLIATNKRVYLTSESEAYLRQWLTELEQDNGGMLSTLPDGIPILFTREDIRRRTKHVAEQMHELLDSVQVVYPNLIDMPLQLVELKDCFDISVLSTLRAALTRSLSWFCIDFNMAKVADSLGCPVVKNCNSMLTNICNLATFKYRKYGIYRHAYEQLPFPLRHQDLLELSRDEEAASATCLAKVLRAYPNAFSNAEQASQALTDFLLPVVARRLHILGTIKSINDAAFPSEVTKVANACFYVASHSDKRNTAEYNFALLMDKICLRLVSLLGMHLSRLVIRIITVLGTAFLRGHFMSIEAVNGYLDGFHENIPQLPSKITSRKGVKHGRRKR